MQHLAIRTLYVYVPLIAIWFAVFSAAAVEPKSQYGGFSSHPDSLQIFNDYIHGQEMTKVEAGAELRQAIEAIPINLEAPIDLKQEADLRTWLYDFLVAFSASGSDSLAAAFYLREGTNNPEAIKELKKQLENEGFPTASDSTPLAIFTASHRYILDAAKREYFFESISFFDSVFKVFEMQEAYDIYEFYLKTHGMIPKGTSSYRLKLQREVEKALQIGESLVFADIMFVVEEPAGVSSWSWQGRTPSFFRLVWDPERAMWRHVEVHFSSGVPQAFLFNLI